MPSLLTIRSRLEAGRMRDPSRRGVILVLSAAFLVAMFGFCAFAIDLGFIVLTMQELQNSADAACLSAVLELKTSDVDLTREQIKKNARDEAKRTAYLNLAATRPVYLEDADITFANRTYDLEADTWINTAEAEGSDTMALNAVQVDVKYDQVYNPDDGSKLNAERRQLDLWFAKVIGYPTASVAGVSKSHLTPRDLVFVIDTSGSMFGQSGGDKGISPDSTMTLMFPFYTKTNRPTGLTTGTNSETARYDALANTQDDGTKGPIKTFFPAEWPQRAFNTANFRGKYKELWEGCFNVTTPKNNAPPCVDINLGTNAIDYIPASKTTKFSLELGESAFGNSTQRNKFLDQEFPDRDMATPWTHWKWKAFCDFAMSTTSKNGDYNAVYNGTDGNLKNLNNYCVPASHLPGVVKEASGTTTHNYAVLGIKMYAKFCNWTGFIPAVAGQKHWPRDANTDGTLDTCPTDPNESYTPQPKYMGNYPRTQDIVGFDPDLLNLETGVYPGELDFKPMSFVRRATAIGINAMIEQEQAEGGGQVAFNQVGLVTFATLGYNDLLLTNNMEHALRATVSRITPTPGNPKTDPHGPGRTNIGSGIRYAVDILTTGPRARSFSNKSMVVLSDGVPNYAPKTNNFDDPEFIGTTFNLKEDTGKAKDYAMHWAGKAYDANIIVHTVSFNLTNDTDKQLLKDLADEGNGLYFDVPGTTAGFAQLKTLFIDIAKDKLGKLYME